MNRNQDQKSFYFVKFWKLAVIVLRATWRTSQPKLKKSKNPFYFRQWNFIALILKKNLMFSQKKVFLEFPEMKPFTFQLKVEK